MFPYYVLSALVCTPLVTLCWCSLTPICYILLVFLITPYCVLLTFIDAFLFYYVGGCQCLLDVFYWCLFTPFHCALLVFVGASLLILVFKYLSNTRCSLVPPCCVLLVFVNASLLCYVNWDSKVIFPLYIFLCRCGISNFIGCTHFLAFFNNKVFFF